MSWSPAMSAARRARKVVKGGQADWLDDPVLAYGLTCDGSVSLTNEMVKARKAHACFICLGSIAPGERVRRETRRNAFDGNIIRTYHVCARCCAAIGRGENPWRT